MAIKIAKPSDAEAKKYPREFAIYTQIPGALSGSVSSEVRAALKTRSYAQHYRRAMNTIPSKAGGESLY